MSPAAPTALRDIESDDLDGHARAQPPWRFGYEQLSRGRFRGRLQQLDLPGMRLWRESATVALRQRGCLADDCFGFALAAGDAPGRFAGQAVDAAAMMTGRGDDVELATAPGFELVAIVVDESLLAPLWQRMYGKPLASWLDRQIVHPIRPAAADALRRAHAEVLATAAAQDSLHSAAWQRVRDELLTEWIEALPPVVDTAPLPALAGRRLLVERAREIALGRAPEVPTVAELCAAVGVGRRRLEYCFVDVLGQSPLQYLRALRLNVVRRELQAAPAACRVQDVATRWGFWHAGQFALDYRRLFGETPSATLQRGAGRAGTPSPPAARAAR